jgi:hypothetical protein
MKKTLLLLIMLLIASYAFASSKHSGFTKHYDNSFFQITENKLYSVELVAKEHELKVGMNKIDIILHDKNDNDLVGAEIEVVPWMPDMGHGVKMKPVITEEGGGLYNAEQLELSMQGLWELRITIMKDGVSDKAVFTFYDIKRGNGGHEHGSMDMSNLDTSTVQMTKHYKVSYMSEKMPIPINQIHSWQLTITKHDGSPVSDADVTIAGDMPIHGHGLPTAPEVTDEIKDGVYLIEGMKFSMPGHWVMQFTIEADGETDMATFNLVVQ